jgi:predicted HTH domain antitoxin
MSKELVLDFPDELKDEDLKDSDVKARAMEAAVLELLKKGKVSQGKAAELLGISRWDISDLMAKYEVPATDLTKEELKEGLKNLKKATGKE